LYTYIKHDFSLNATLFKDINLTSILCSNDGVRVTGQTKLRWDVLNLDSDFFRVDHGPPSILPPPPTECRIIEPLTLVPQVAFQKIPGPVKIFFQRNVVVKYI